MGLRIGADAGALSALRSLQRTSGGESISLERLASGIRLNRASDSPSGLVLIEPLRLDLDSLRQAVENTQAASNMVGTADAALDKVGDLLVRLRSNFVAALNDRTGMPEVTQALQAAVDQGLRAIDRIGTMTRVDGRGLLNGGLAFQLSGADPQLRRVEVQGGSFPGGFPVRVAVDVASAAAQARAPGAISADPQLRDSVIRIAGNRGAQEISIEAGATRAEVVRRINDVRDLTGVEADSNGFIRSVGYGSEATVSFQELSGDLAGVVPGYERGTDVVGTIRGIKAAGRGNTLQVNTPALAAEVAVEPGATGRFGFTIAGGGAHFQLGPVGGGLDDLALGIGTVSTATLGPGGGGGNLSTLAAGGANNVARNPSGALAVLDEASAQVAALRGRLGAVSGRIFEANFRALGAASQGLYASLSEVRDANAADEIAALVRNRLLGRTGLAAVKASGLNAGLALRLL